MLHLFNSPNHLENSPAWNTDMPLSADIGNKFKNVKLTVIDFKKDPSRALDIIPSLVKFWQCIFTLQRILQTLFIFLGACMSSDWW